MPIAYDTELQPATLNQGGSGFDGRLPPMPEDDDLGKFLDFVHDLLGYWVGYIDRNGSGYEYLSGEDRSVVRAGWADFDRHWRDQRGSLMEIVRLLYSEGMAETMQHRGLVEAAVKMKFHMVRKWWRELRDRLARGGQEAAGWVRDNWRKLFEMANVILDSVKEAIDAIPAIGNAIPHMIPAKGILSGLTEFKDTAMNLSHADGAKA